MSRSLRTTFQKVLGDPLRAADHPFVLRTENKESKMIGVTLGIVGICLFAMMAFCNAGLK